MSDDEKKDGEEPTTEAAATSDAEAAQADEPTSPPEDAAEAKAEPAPEKPSSGKKGKKKKAREDEAKAAASEAPDPESEAEAEPDAVPAREAAASTRTGAHARWPGYAMLALGLLGDFLIMSFHEQLPRGPLMGIACTLFAALGLVDVLGLLRTSALTDAERASAIDWKGTWIAPQKDEIPYFAPVYTLPLAIGIALAGALQPDWQALPIWIVVALLVLALPAVRRPALLVFVIASGIILPMLGAYGLWDPWETHYGEVAREMLSRDDWISLWWAHEEWFFSKPIFIFWIEALSMGALGVNFHPDGHPMHPEWAIRFPHYLLTLGALIAIYTLISRTFGKRAGALAAIVVATLPHFFMLSHQAITDMPFVSTMTIAMCMLGLAVREDGAREVRIYRMGPIAISARTLALGALFAVAIPQIMYLLTRNVTLVTGGFSWHHDSFLFGSGGGNAGNPGNPAPRTIDPYLQGIGAEPAMQGLYWLAGLSIVIFLFRKEKRAQSIAMLGFYVFCALSFMAKGIPGFAIPGMVALLYLITSRRWDLLLEGKLKVAVGILVVLVVGMPWYVAMFIRHGPAFTDRILIHDHLNRLTAGVHGDTGSIEYFFEQLGYGLFPWIALAPLAVAAWIRFGTRRGSDQRLDPQREVMMVVGLWGTSAFVLFSAMTTKFHHYIFPAVPAAGILIGIAFDPLLGRDSRSLAKRVLGTLAAGAGAVMVVLGIAGWLGDPRGVAPEEAAAPADWVLANPWPTSYVLAAITFGFVLAGLAWWVLRPEPEPSTTEPVEEGGYRDPAGAERTVAGKVPDDGPQGWLASVGLFVAPAIVALIGRDLSWVTESHPWGFERLIHLFVYNYQRPWPTHFDYRPVLTGFAIVATTTIGLAAFRELRPLMTRAFLGTAVAFACWSLDLYLVDLAPHWGQREIIERYYELREPGEHIIAWQMNWKGENFYTGNAVYTFVDLDTRPLVEWTRQHPGERVFVVLEHSRVGSLRSTIHGATVTPVTTEREDNKFGVVLVQLPGERGSAPPPPTTPTPTPHRPPPI
jgi:4-amino-4-deoxy-L-arabinose transferase-like glycosyltransferase